MALNQLSRVMCRLISACSPFYLLDIWPAVSPQAKSFLLLFAADNQSSPLFEGRSIFALQICLRKPKPGRGDVMMAITYNALASCRCTEPILSRAMTSALGVQREHLPDDLVSRMHVWSGAGNYAGEASRLWVRANILLSSASCAADEAWFLGDAVQRDVDFSENGVLLWNNHSVQAWQ